MSWKYSLICILFLRPLLVYAEHAGATHHPVDDSVDAEYLASQAISKISLSNDKDTQVLRILVRIDKRTAEQLALVAIANLKVSKDPEDREVGERLDKMIDRGTKMGRLAIAFKRMSQEELDKRKFDGIIIGLLEKFLKDGRKIKKTFTKNHGWGVSTTGTIEITDVSPARNLQEYYADKVLGRFPQKSIADGQIFSLMEMKMSTTAWGKSAEKHPIELVLQVLEEDPKPVKIGGRFHALIDVSGSDGTPTVRTKFNTRFDNEKYKKDLHPKSRQFLLGPNGDDGLLNEYDGLMRDAIKVKPPQKDEEKPGT